MFPCFMMAVMIMTMIMTTIMMACELMVSPEISICIYQSPLNPYYSTFYILQFNMISMWSFL